MTATNTNTNNAESRDHYLHKQRLNLVYIQEATSGELYEIKYMIDKELIRRGKTL
jgi:hypothetical protein